MAQMTRPLCIKPSVYSNTCVLYVCLYVCKTITPKRLKIGFQDQLSLNAGQKYCKIKLPFVIKIFVLSIMSCHFTKVLLYVAVVLLNIRILLCLNFSLQSSASNELQFVTAISIISM